jgi:hypothetical protein
VIRDQVGRFPRSLILHRFRKRSTDVLQNDPSAMEPAIARMRAYEQASGFSWQQRGPIDELVAAAPVPRYRQQLLLSTE